MVCTKKNLIVKKYKLKTKGKTETDWSMPEYNSVLYGNGGANFYLLTYGDNKFISISNAGVKTSTNGVDWENITNTSLMTSMNSSTYGDGKFVVIGKSGSNSGVRTSADGTTWTNFTNVSNFSAYQYFALSYGSNKFVAIDIRGSVFTSTNATTWSSITNLGNNSWYGLAYDGTKFVALSSTGYISTSTDGVTWTTAVLNTELGSNHWMSIVFLGDKFIALGQEGYTSTSTDGINWSTAVQNTNLSNLSLDSGTWWRCAYGNDNIVAIGTKSYSPYVSIKKYGNTNKTYTLTREKNGTTTRYI